ncbi:MAG: 50S ribosomal protein L11 methyltransferase [Polyangiaceae bacterium]|nr:50S ribosomal protein L11 methyltransferase [Polyangiaceae bacterium]
MTLKRIIFPVSPEGRDALSACLFDAGAGAVEEQDEGLSTYAETTEALEQQLDAHSVFRAHCAAAALDFSLGAVRIEDVTNDWQQTWQSALKEVALTQNLRLIPVQQPDAAQQIYSDAIYFLPDASFGSGDHATTQLAARRIENLVQQGHQQIFDVGTGNGVLALVAVHAGATEVLASDIDEIAIRSARKNIELNQMQKAIRLLPGSADVDEGSFDLVVANIATTTLLDLKVALIQRVNAGGYLLLTGILAEDGDSVAQAYAEQGCTEEERHELDGWVLLVLRKSRSSA